MSGHRRVLRTVATGRDAGVDWALGAEPAGDRAVAVELRVDGAPGGGRAVSAVTGPTSLAWGIGGVAGGVVTFTCCAGPQVETVEVIAGGRAQHVALYRDPEGRLGGAVGGRVFAPGTRITEVIARSGGDAGAVTRHVLDHPPGRRPGRRFGWITSLARRLR